MLVSQGGGVGDDWCDDLASHRTRGRVGAGIDGNRPILEGLYGGDGT